MGTAADNAPVSTDERVIPSQGVPGPVTEMAVRRFGESPQQALDRIGNAVLPPAVRSMGKGKQLPRNIAAIMAMRTEGMKDKEIAERLGVSVTTIRNAMGRARRDYGLDDVGDRIKNRGIPTAIDNVIDRMDDGDYAASKWLLEKTIFKKEQKGDKGSGGNTLTVKIELPEIPEGAPTVAVGAIVGRPQSQAIEGEVLNASS